MDSLFENFAFHVSTSNQGGVLYQGDIFFLLQWKNTPWTQENKFYFED